jgi:hypothetical protein
MGIRVLSKFLALIFLGQLLISMLCLKLMRVFTEVELFESIISSSVIATLFLILLTYLLWYKKVLTVQLVPTVCWALLTSMLFVVILGPNTVMNIDRSRSFYILSWVQNGGIRIDDGKLLMQVDSPERLNTRGIQERLLEQSSRGLLELRGQTYYLTDTGKITLSVANAIANFYHLDGWFKNRN